MIKENKKQYTPELMHLATQISNTGSITISSTAECTRAIIHFLTDKEPDHWLSTGTVLCWNKEVATSCLHQNCPKDTNSHFYFCGIMCDENNIAYMSGFKSGAVVKFNLMCQSSSYQIPCGLYALQITLVNFETTTIGKNNSPSGLSLEQQQPYNLLSLTYHLHGGYNEGNKEIFKFLTGFDTLPRIVTEDETRCLPFGNCAHEIPDQVLIWIDELKKAEENPEKAPNSEDTIPE
ncbi:19686_t:CDS:2 [Entrophospora sp. SA101]|nr:19686_t:CDS:2 [Entrophospora sp. SA101]